MNTYIFIIEIVGTIAFAISGAMTGIEKKMDIFGISILGLTTAVGGGIIRDLVIGVTPPQTFRNPIYAATAIATAMLIFALAYYRKLIYNTKLFERLVFVMDSLGLGIFTVVGISTTLSNINQTQSYGRFFVDFCWSGNRCWWWSIERCDGREYAIHFCEACLRMCFYSRGSGMCLYRTICRDSKCYDFGNGDCSIDSLFVCVF